MSITKINLRKLLRLFLADEKQQRALLREDIRNDRRRASALSGGSGGGDFYVQFWADVKAHAAGESDIRDQTAIRIGAKSGRARLYPILRDAFLEMWNERMRFRNEPFEFVSESVKAQLVLDGLNATIKIENTAAIRTWDGSHRLMYPYFSERPALSEQGARLGFWALNEALPQYAIEDFRIIDFQRRAYFRPADVVMKGDEGTEFLQRYDALLREWRKLRDDE
jgi:hypothetical protein